MDTPQSDRVAARRAASAQLAQQKKAKKLHAIAERRAGLKGISKEAYIAEIVKGKYPPITAADLAAEPTPD